MTGTSTTFWGAMTTAQITALSAPQPGDRAYDTDKDMVVRYDGTNWLEENSRHQIQVVRDGTAGVAAAPEVTSNGITTRDFDDGGVNNSEDVELLTVIPRHYVPGRQIFLRITYSSNDATGGNAAKVSTLRELYQVDDVLGTPGDTATDSLRDVPVSSVANSKEVLETIPITDASGEVGATAVAPGDFLRINFLRQGNDANDDMVGDLKVWSFELTW